MDFPWYSNEVSGTPDATTTLVSDCPLGGIKRIKYDAYLCLGY